MAYTSYFYIFAKDIALTAVIITIRKRR